MRGEAKKLTRTELPKYGEKKLAFKDLHKQMKAPYVIYADLKYLLRKIQSHELPKDGRFTVKTEMH